MTKTEKELEKIVAPVVQSLGYKLYDVEYLKEGGEWYLRIYIDQENGIDLDDCEKVSEAVGEELDRVDPIATSYSLEVSSCGLERKLREPKHFMDAIGKNVEVTLYKSMQDSSGKKIKTIDGVLEHTDETKIMVTKEKEKYEIELENIANAKILFDWEE